MWTSWLTEEKKKLVKVAFVNKLKKDFFFFFFEYWRNEKNRNKCYKFSGKKEDI